MAFFLLEGGAEFGGRMSEPDLRAMELAGGLQACIVILPTAAAPDHNHLRAGGHGQRWFESLGASCVDVLPVTDKASANNPVLAARLTSARLIYLLGGFPRYLYETLSDSRVWRTALEAHHNGAVLAGSSAGAMVLCEYYYDPSEGKLLRGFNLLKNVCVLPHHDRFGKNWVSKLGSLIPQATLVGLDERTGMINDAADGAWTVSGAGGVTLYRGGHTEVHAPGETFPL